MSLPYNSLQQAVGALLVGKLPGVDLPAEAAECFKRGWMGGITVFKENCASPEQLVNVLAGIRAVCKIEPVLTVDQEGGPVQRLEDIVTPLPSFRLLGELHDANKVKGILSVAARELSLLGFNVVLAPVLDVATNPFNPIIGVRSFAETAEAVIANGRAALAAYLEQGVVPVGKHFPGHGDTAQDSHSCLAVVNGDKERLYTVELAPFRELLTELPALLIAHVWVSSLLPEPLPATLSTFVVEGLLKQEMGFSGCVFTDDMLMKAITNEYGLEEACIQAVIAGCDQILVCSSVSDVLSVHAALVKAVEQGRISETRLSEALQKRERLLSLARPQVESIDKRLALLQELSLFHKKEVKQAYKDGFARKGNCSLQGARTWLVVSPRHPRYGLDLCESLIKEGSALDLHFASYHYPWPLQEIDLCEVEGEVQKVLTKISDFNGNEHGLGIIFVSFRAQLDPAQVRLAKQLALKSEKIILVVADNPCDSALFDFLPDQLLTYDPSSFAIQCVASALLPGKE